jgi:Sensors of blue-light using FAD
MLSLVYVSSATRNFSEPDLVALLKQSQENNARLGITGMLLHKDGNFIQVLEGPDEAVNRLFETINSDERHQGTIRLLDRQVEQREFPDWSMGFRNLKDPAIRELPGFSEFMNEPLNSDLFRKDANRARKLLGIFRRDASS